MEQRQRADDDYVATQAALAQANEGKEQLQKKIRGIKDDARVEVETCRGYRLDGMSLKDLEVNDIFNYGNMFHTSHTGLLPVCHTCVFYLHSFAFQSLEHQQEEVLGRVRSAKVCFSVVCTRMYAYFCMVINHRKSVNGLN